VKVMFTIPDDVYLRLIRLAMANSPEHQTLVYCLVREIDDEPSVTHLLCDHAGAEKLMLWVRRVAPDAASQIQMEEELDC
jgi:hypothetical protein